MILKYFKADIIFTIFALALAAFVGYEYGGLTFAYFLSALLLAILEVSVSLDNAVVNATVLKNMSPLWQRRFLTWGIAIAVFGMRLVFPLLIVSIAGSVSPYMAAKIAFTDPAHYETLLTSVHVQLMAFGGAFLLMIFSAHFIAHEKETHWIPGVGHILSKLGKHGSANLFIPISIIITFATIIKSNEFLVSAIWGVVVYLIVEGLGDLLSDNISEETEDDNKSINLPAAVAKTGLAGFIYLEVLDASFSFDGVIAAFAITNNFIIIMIGLGIGAMFVRSLTIMFVDVGALDELCYLEDGAFWGIGYLVVSMFLSVMHIELGEMLVAGGTAAIIILAAIHSVYKSREVNS